MATSYHNLRTRRLYRKQFNYDQLVQDQLQGTTSVSVGQTKTFGPNFADWKSRIAEGRNATTSFDGTFVNMSSSADGSAIFGYRRKNKPKATDERTRYEFRGHLCAGFTPSDPSLSLTSARNQAIIRFVERARSAQSACKGLVVVGELSKTLKMIRHPLKSLYSGQFRYLDSVKKRVRARNFRKKASRSNVLKVLGDTWLEFQFGWRPLIRDVEDGMKSLNSVVTYRMPRVFIRAKGRSSALTSRQVSDIQSSIARLRRVASFRDEAEYKLYGLVKAELPDGLSRAATAFGFTWPEFVPAIWELIPYSFLVDYFTNIGGIISCCTFPKASVVWSSFGSSRSSIMKVEPEFYRSSALSSLYEETHFSFVPGDPLVVTKRILQRGVYTGTYIPSLELSIPGLSMRWLNMSALLAQSRSVSRLISS